MGKLKFKENDWVEITEYLKEWETWRKEGKVGRPDYTTDIMYLVPFTIALMKSQDKIEKLTYVLIFLTLVLVVLTIILAIPVIKDVL